MLKTHACSFKSQLYITYKLTPKDGTDLAQLRSGPIVRRHDVVKGRFGLVVDNLLQVRQMILHGHVEGWFEMRGRDVGKGRQIERLRRPRLQEGIGRGQGRGRGARGRWGGGGHLEGRTLGCSCAEVAMRISRKALEGRGRMRRGQ